MKCMSPAARVMSSGGIPNLGENTCVTTRCLFWEWVLIDPERTIKEKQVFPFSFLFAAFQGKKSRTLTYDSSSISLKMKGNVWNMRDRLISTSKYGNYICFTLIVAFETLITSTYTNSKYCTDF